MKTEKHEPCGFSYIIVRSDGATFSPFTYKGEDAVFVFLVWLQNHEREMREDMAKEKTGKNTGTLTAVTYTIKVSSKVCS